MRSILTLFVLAAVACIGLYVGGVFGSDGAGTKPDGGTPAEPGPEGTGNGASENGTELVPDTGTRPTNRPDLELLEFPEGTRVLLLGMTPIPPDVLMLNTLRATSAVSWHGWFLSPSEGARVDWHGGAIEPLTDVPTGLTLTGNDYRVVVVSNIDLSLLPDDFWDTLASRVESGLTHVLWRTWPPYAYNAEASDHPWLDDPVVSRLLPVAKIAPLRAAADQMTLPGSFGAKGTRFVVTEAGMSHPASRLVSDPEWSRAWWLELTSGKGALGTKFCCPVTRLRSGARVLLGAEVPNADDLPALVAGSVGDGRVLWLGTRELSWEAMYNTRSERRLKLVLNNMLAWLAGAAAE